MIVNMFSLFIFSFIKNENVGAVGNKKRKCSCFSAMLKSHLSLTLIKAANLNHKFVVVIVVFREDQESKDLRCVVFD